MTREEEVNRARQAKRLLEEPLLREVRADLEKLHITRWRRSNAEQQQMREHTWLYLRTLDDVFQQLQNIADRGTVSRDEITTGPGG